MKENKQEEKRFMTFPVEGIKAFQDLLAWEISKYHDGINVNFCRYISEKLEYRFQQLYKRPSKIHQEDRFWISESTISRWLRSGMLDVKIQLLNYLSCSQALKNPKTLIPLTVNELVSLLQGNLTLEYPENTLEDNGMNDVIQSSQKNNKI